MTTEAHSKFSPSSMHRTVVCTGWLAQSAGIPDEPTEDSMLGDAAHWVGMKILESFKQVKTAGLVGPNNFVDKPAPNGVIIDSDTFDCVEGYAQYVARFVTDWSCVQIERRMYIKSIHEECFGTPDVSFFTDDRTLHVIDYKHGHRRVEAFMNEQEVAYAMGMIELTGIIPDNIVFHIYQPRCYDGRGPVTTWSLTYNRLVDEVEVLKTACRDSEFDPRLNPTSSGCRDCPARYTCPALREVAAGLPPPNMTPHNNNEPNLPCLAYELKVLKEHQSLLDARTKGLEQYIETLIKSGKRVPGWLLESKSGRNQWKESDDMILALGEVFGVDFRSNSLVSPAQAIKILKEKNIDDSVIKSYYEKRPSSPTLVSDELKVKLIFGDI